MVRQPKSIGGLTIKDPEFTNLALVAKTGLEVTFEVKLVVKKCLYKEVFPKKSFSYT